MSRGAAYARFRLRGVHVFDPGIEIPSLVVYDVGAAAGSVPLELKLRQLPHRLRYPSTLVLRGVTDFHRAELSADIPIRDMFPAGTRIFELAVGDLPTLLPHLGTPSPTPSRLTDVTSRVRYHEVAALLHWTDSIWKPNDFHFILPSGEHSDTFIRVADIFSEPINAFYLADWCAIHLMPRTAIFSDTPTLFPLAQELELRAVRRFQNAQIMKSHAQRYHTPRDELREQLGECIAWLRDTGDPGILLCLVSVSASGAYIRRLQRTIQDIDSQISTKFVTLCDAGEPSVDAALTAVEIVRYSADLCSLCAHGSQAIEIDQRRFTTRVVSGARVVSLPAAQTVQMYAQRIEELDHAGALAVHVERPGHHDHLSVYIDTAKALQCGGLRKDAERVIGELYPDEGPDLVLLPLHGDSDVLRGWLHEQGLNCAAPVPPFGGTPMEVEEAVGRARRILVCDDAVMTSKTMRGLLQYVQRVKGALRDEEFDLRAFALIARTEDAGTWTGLRNRFFIGHESRLKAAWIAHLPSPGRGCPWCYEAAALADLAPRLSGVARHHLEQRLSRLRSAAGLRDHIFLGSEAGQIDGPFDDGTRITPQSYLGQISELGAYVASALLMQQLRNDWKKNTASVHQRFVVPTARFLRQYTDPILAAGLLRAAKSRELWAAETVGDLIEALSEVDHPRQHPVLIAEALWASTRDKLPRAAGDLYVRHLDALPQATGSWLRSLVTE